MNISDSPEITLAPNTIGITVHFGEHGMALLHKIGQVLTTDLTKDLKFKKNHAEDLKQTTFIDQLKKRRSIYVLGKRVHLSQVYLAELIQEAVRSCPSAHNSQSTCIVILMGDSHHHFWNVVKEVQRKLVPAHIVAGAELKVDQCSAGFGTVLFYEDQQIIQQLQKKIPFDAAEFPIWSEQVSGMAQYAVWTCLADAGLGASLQHYNPSIDADISKVFEIPKHWLLRAQLVFGSIEEKVAEKEHYKDEERFMIYA